MSIAVNVGYSLPIPTRIHTVAASEDSRYSFTSVAAFIPTEGPAALVATDGRRAAVVPVPVEDRGSDSDAVARIPREAFKACRWHKNRPLPAYTVTDGVGRVSTAPDTAYPVSRDPFPFPPVSQVCPSEAQIRKGVVLTFNAELLAGLATALGSEGQVTIVADPEGAKPMIVLPTHGSSEVYDSVRKAFGLLMPMSGANSEGARVTAIEHAIDCVGNGRRILERAETRREGAKRS